MTINRSRSWKIGGWGGRWGEGEGEVEVGETTLMPVLVQLFIFLGGTRDLMLEVYLRQCLFLFSIYDKTSYTKFN